LIDMEQDDDQRIFDREDLNRAVSTLWNFLRLEEEPKKSDAIFVFGCAQRAVPQHAARLFHQGIAPVVLVSGSMGVTAAELFGKSESEVFKEELLASGVPEDRIFVDDKATNTGENILFGMKMLHRQGINPRALVFLSQPYHALRCKATFRLREPNIETYSCPPPGGPEQFIPFTKERFALKMVGEVDRLIRYPKQGLIDYQETIPPSVLEATELIRKSVKE